MTLSRWLLASLCIVSGYAVAAPTNIKLEPLRVREFDPGKGEWLDLKLFSPEFFMGWNWRNQRWGGSDDDLQIILPITGQPSTRLPTPIVLTLTSRRTGKVVQRRSFVDVMIPASGTTHQSLVASNLACDGGLDAVATYGSQKRHLHLGLDCGE